MISLDFVFQNYVHFCSIFAILVPSIRDLSRYLCTDISDDSKDISAVALLENVPFNHEPQQKSMYVSTYQILMLLSRRFRLLYIVS